MCTLFSNTLPVEAMRRLFAVDPAQDALGNLAPLPAIFPRQNAPVLRLAEDGRRALGLMHWGFLMPQVSRATGAPILPKAVVNARDDRLRASPFWRESFERRRCLIPATAFCEASGAKPAAYHWFAVTGEEPRPPFAFAGLWRRFKGRYRDAEPVTLDTVTMITTTPNAVVRPIHPDRMPAILPPEAWEVWLTGAPDAAHRLIAPWPAERMRVAASGVGLKADPGAP